MDGSTNTVGAPVAAMDVATVPVDLPMVCEMRPSAVVVIGADTEVGSYVAESLLLSGRHVIAAEVERRPAEVPVPWRYGFMEGSALKARGVEMVVVPDARCFRNGVPVMASLGPVADWILSGDSFCGIGVEAVYDFSLMTRKASPVALAKLFERLEGHCREYLSPGAYLPPMVVVLPESCIEGDLAADTLPDGRTLVATYARRLLSRAVKALPDGCLPGRSIQFVVVPHHESPRSDLRKPARRVARQVARIAVGKVPTVNGRGKVSSVTGAFQFRHAKEVAARLIEIGGADSWDVWLKHCLFPYVRSKRPAVTMHSVFAECQAALQNLTPGAAAVPMEFVADVERNEDRDPVMLPTPGGSFATKAGDTRLKDLARSLVRSEIRLAKLEGGRRYVVKDFLSTPLKVRKRAAPVNAEGAVSEFLAGPWSNALTPLPRLTFDDLTRARDAVMSAVDPFVARKRIGFPKDVVRLRRPVDGLEFQMAIPPSGIAFPVGDVVMLLRFLRGA